MPLELRFYVERVTGIEPAWPAWKTVPARNPAHLQVLMTGNAPARHPLPGPSAEPDKLVGILQGCRCHHAHYDEGHSLGAPM